MRGARGLKIGFAYQNYLLFAKNRKKSCVFSKLIFEILLPYVDLSPSIREFVGNLTLLMNYGIRSKVICMAKKNTPEETNKAQSLFGTFTRLTITKLRSKKRMTRRI